MSRLIAQILLSLLVFPLAGVLYTVAFIASVEAHLFGSRHRDESSFVMAGCLAWAFIAIYWWLLWRKRVRWTAQRVIGTLACFVGAAVGGVILGFACSGVTIGMGHFVATVTAPLLWQFGTILLWQESPAERAARIAGAGLNAVVCPTCGYNLTGLNSTRCPECGSTFTLDQLLASQPGRTPDDLAA